MLIQNLEIMCRLKEFAAHRIAEQMKRCCLFSQPFALRNGKSGTVLHNLLKNVIEALPMLGYKAVGPGSLLINMVDFESLLCIRCIFSL